MEKQKEGINCVLLLEDAEQLLVSRKGDERTLGISNLLNITDGILNDLLHIQVIATFNTNISNIDEALTRPERLIARKNFKKLSKEKTKELVDFLKIDISVNSGMTLAEIYSRLSLNQPLLHDQDSTRDSIGFKRGY
jgi:SpoVK/Ycf46/Vps4 family AAA+-type ATPase